MLKTFLLHVKKGSEARLDHMTNLMSSHNLPFELILDGDIPDLTDSIIDKYFIDSMLSKSAQTSCAYKHFLCYEKMVTLQIDYALIVEDDIFFLAQFDKILQSAIDERATDKNPWYIGFEATHLRMTPRSQRRKNIVTYKSDAVQCTGAYLINKAAAEIILKIAESEKCDLPIDIYLNKLQQQGHFTLYWSYPPIVEQGSLNGKMSSLISGTQQSRLKTLTRKLTFIYKQCLYFFR